MRTTSTIGDAALRIALLAVVLLLGACVSGPEPITVASIDSCRVETRRELRHVGPPGKSLPMSVTRQLQVCRPAGGSSERVLTSR